MVRLQPTLNTFCPSLVCLALAVCSSAPPAQDKPAATGRIIGRVVDALGQPIPVAEVVVRGLRKPKTVIAKSRTDGEGMFVLAHLPLSDDYLTVHATTTGRIAARDSVRVTVARPWDSALIRLWDAADVRGRAVDDNGKPVVGAAVVAAFDASRLFGFEPNVETVTDKDGRFVLPKVPLGSIHIRAAAHGYVVAEETVYLEKATEIAVQMTRGEGVKLTVQVEGIAAENRRAARVRVLPYRSSGRAPLPARLTNGQLDDHGNWSVAGLPDFDYRVSVTLDGYVFEPRMLQGKRTEGPHRLVFRARSRATMKLRGALHSPDGKAIVGQTVLCRASSSLLGSRAVTDSQGAFVLESPLGRGEKCILQLIGSRWVLTQTKSRTHHVHDMRFLKYHEARVDPAKPFVLRAIRSSRVLGRVVDGRGSPVRLETVIFEHMAPNRRPLHWMPVAWATSDQEGRFVFAGLHAFDHDLRLRVSGTWGAGVSDTFHIAIGKDVKDLNISTLPSGIVEGVVLDGNEKPVPGARVRLRNWDLQLGRQNDGGVEEVLADRNGRYRHVGVEPGGHYLNVYVVGRRTAFTGLKNDTFEVKAGEVVKLELRVSR